THTHAHAHTHTHKHLELKLIKMLRRHTQDYLALRSATLVILSVCVRLVSVCVCVCESYFGLVCVTMCLSVCVGVSFSALWQQVETPTLVTHRSVRAFY